LIKRNITIVNKLGLHARAAAKFVTCASQFSSDIQISRNAQQVNGKSIMGVMMLAANKGSELAITADGEDETDAIAALEALILNRFEEDE
jgi:phosphocarrier protein